MFLTTDDKQFGFWALKRSGESNIGIANRFGISRQAVSRALLLMDGKIETTLSEMAQANQIAIEKINAGRGSLSDGRSLSRLQRSSSCRRSMACRSGTSMTATAVRASGTPNASSPLWDYANELGVRIEKTADPTKMAEELFVKVKAIA